MWKYFRMKAPLAIVTMVYNEPDFLPIWLRHYARHVDETACYIIDHGSDDGSTDDIGSANRIRIPRSPQNDTLRAEFISDFCSTLLCWYDAVIYVDVDELLVPDPARWHTLKEYAVALPPHQIVTAIGLDIIHRPGEERPYLQNKAISSARSFARFSSAMCKPALIRRPTRWSPGFHCTNAPPLFDDLFLFHLRYADLDIGLKRLQRTRSQPWSDAGAGSHQRMPDMDWENMLRGMSALPEQEDVDFHKDDPVLGIWMNKVLESCIGREQETYRFDLHISGDRLWRIPKKFLGTF